MSDFEKALDSHIRKIFSRRIPSLYEIGNWSREFTLKEFSTLSKLLIKTESCLQEERELSFKETKRADKSESLLIKALEALEKIYELPRSGKQNTKDWQMRNEMEDIAYSAIKKIRREMEGK